ncbi:hypothetical protein Asppvi_000168 [Aspergillus pseudoviridinutans]|uniref:Ankyrin repeat-containing domain protein n=1 Tax=Aspergillus pseudoviridinutans TaxID=1517512 RepID=A0A9P3EP24_9EURO|nr:uncharacterized protein Asppvi_000168 [Aspergillus pseudoviridinutans]GIJ81669.1 hypothetical protein Asppvi_000168 [Aspergillus pseudoviridinutans]
MIAVLPPEILHDILGRTTPSWRWGWRWKKCRRVMLARADLTWFLNLRLVSKQLHDIVIDHFLTAIRVGLIDRELPICHGAPTPSTMAMARRLLCSLVGRSCDFQGLATRSVYPLANTINAGADGVVEFFSQRSDIDPGELRTSYLSGMISMGWEETMDDGLDYERDGWSGAALMATAYLGRIDDMEALLAWRIENTADPNKSLHLPLMTAAFGGQEESVRLLIDKGVNINIRTVGNGDTVLHLLPWEGMHLLSSIFWRLEWTLTW